jgi:uracil-DNA glycosylase
MKRIAFIGQAMPRSKKHPHDWPSLNKWLYLIGITDSDIENNFFYSALIDYFPGSKDGAHLIPNKKQIQKDTDRLKKDLLHFNPEIVVPVGRLSILNCLNIKIKHLDDIIGNKYVFDPYCLLDRKIVVIPFPHPSGASTWHKTINGKKLLEKALKLLKQNLD